MCHYLDLADNQHLLWSRRCEYFDQALTDVLHSKLRATFDESAWDEALVATAEDFLAERRVLRHQLNAVQQKMKALLENFSYLRSSSLLQALEGEYANYELEEERLERKLAELERRSSQQDDLLALARHAENVLATWAQMDVPSKQAVTNAFIERIVVTPLGKYRVVNVEIHWRDNSSDTVQIAYRADGSTIWFPEEVDTLTDLLENQASQIEISEALPTRNWRAIRLKVYEIIGRRNFNMSPKPIRDEETYKDFLIRVERDGEKALRTSGNRWSNHEINQLEQLLERGATQLEIAAALPVRTWEAIRKKTAQLHGDSSMVTETGQLENGETIADYLVRVPSAAGTMPFLISKNCSRQIPTEVECHRSRRSNPRLNIAALLVNSVLLPAEAEE